MTSDNMMDIFKMFEKCIRVGNSDGLLLKEKIRDNISWDMK